MDPREKFLLFVAQYAVVFDKSCNTRIGLSALRLARTVPGPNVARDPETCAYDLLHWMTATMIDQRLQERTDGSSVPPRTGVPERPAWLPHER